MVRIPNVNETGDLLSIAQYSNNIALGGILFPVILLVIWIIAFVGSIAENRQASRAFVFSSFFCSVLGMMLAVLNLLNMTYVYFLFLMVGLGLFWINLANAKTT